MHIPSEASVAKRARRIGAGLVALALVATVGSAAGADTQSKLNDAEHKLSQLETRIHAEQQRADAVRVNLVKLQGKVDAAQSAFDQVDVQLINLRDSLSITQAEYEAAQGHLDDVARQAYMDGPGASLEMLLGATSMGDLNDRLEFMSSVTLENANLAGEAQLAASTLGDRRSSLDQLLARQADLLRGLNSSQASLSSALDAHQQAMDELNQTREQIVSIIGHLSAKLQADAINGAGGVLQGNHNAPYGVGRCLPQQDRRAHVLRQPGDDGGLAGPGGDDRQLESARHHTPDGRRHQLQLGRCEELRLDGAGTRSLV